MDTFAGYIEKIVYRNEDNGYTVLELSVDGESEMLTGLMQQVAVGLNNVDAFVINYYGTMFNAVLTETGFDMDYYGTMTLHFVPAE